jgi:hypothetical protein
VSHRNDTDIFKEIYRAAEQEGWSKDKLFKTLADPSKFKKSTRYILYKKIEEKKLAKLTGNEESPKPTLPVVQRMMVDAIEREVRKNKLEKDHADR